MPRAYFIGKLVYRPYVGTESPYKGSDPGLELLEDFTFVDSRAIKWTAHKGDIVDGASIPAILRPFVSFPYTGGKLQDWYFPASVIHDVYSRDQHRPKSDTDRAFFEAMMANGVMYWKAFLMWAAVSLFGPQW